MASLATASAAAPLLDLFSEKREMLTAERATELLSQAEASVALVALPALWQGRRRAPRFLCRHCSASCLRGLST